MAGVMEERGGYHNHWSSSRQGIGLGEGEGDVNVTSSWLKNAICLILDAPSHHHGPPILTDILVKNPPPPPPPNIPLTNLHDVESNAEVFSSDAPCSLVNLPPLLTAGVLLVQTDHHLRVITRDCKNVLVDVARRNGGEMREGGRGEGSEEVGERGRGRGGRGEGRQRGREGEGEGRERGRGGRGGGEGDEEGEGRGGGE